MSFYEMRHTQFILFLNQFGCNKAVGHVVTAEET